MKRGPFIAGVGLLGVIALVPALVPSAVAADEQYGATVPYTRYEAEGASSDLRSRSDADASKFNSFVGNTVELGWRAGGIGLFGGEGHVVTDNLIVRPYAEGIRADFGLGEDALSGRGITLRDNKRDDEAAATEQAQIVNHVLVGDQVVRDVPETENYSLCWYQRDERGAHGTIDRYWVSKADGVDIMPDMEYSVEGGKRVYNVTLADLPQYLPTSTDFFGSCDYVADLERSWPADDGTTIVIRFWLAK